MTPRTRRFTGMVIAGALALLLSGSVLGASDGIDRDSAAAWQELQFRLAPYLQIDADPRRQLVGAMLLSIPAASGSPADERAAAAARQAEAQAIFARVRAGTDDPWILWVAVTDCRVGQQLCDADGAIDRLLRIEPDNAAVWQLALDRAYRAKDRDGMLAALRGMAASTRHDIHFIDAVRAWSGAFATVAAWPELDPLVERTVRRVVGGGDGEREQAIDVLALYAAQAGAYGIPSFVGLTDSCKPELVSEDTWIQACRGAAEVMIDADTLVGIGAGIAVAYRLARDDEERVMLENRRLHMDWLIDSFGRIQGEDVDETGIMGPALAREILHSWSNASSELEATRALLRARGMSLEPPPDYKRRGPSLAERESEQMQQRRSACAGQGALALHAQPPQLGCARCRDTHR